MLRSRFLWGTIPWCFWLLLCLQAHSGLVEGQTVHNVTHAYLDSFECTQNASASSGTLLAGNTAALETLRQWCAADARCAQLYGQDITPNLSLFIHLFQTTYDGSVSTAELEEPLFDLLCNQTGAAYLALTWPLILRQQILDSSNVCDVNERPVLNSNTGQVDCDCQPGKVCDAQTGSFVGATIIAIALILAVTAQFGVILWYNTNRGRDQPLRTRIGTSMARIGTRFVSRRTRPPQAPRYRQYPEDVHETTPGPRKRR